MLEWTVVYFFSKEDVLMFLVTQTPSAGPPEWFPRAESRRLAQGPGLLDNLVSLNLQSDLRIQTALDCSEH